MTYPSIQYPRDALVEARPDLSAEMARWLHELIDVAFFSSFENEERQRTCAKVVFHPRGIEGLLAVTEIEQVGSSSWPTLAWQVLAVAGGEQVTRFTVEGLVKAAPMALLPRTALVVRPSESGLAIEGIARRMDRSIYATTGEDDVVVCTSHRPGQVVLSAKGYPFFWYEQGRALNISHGTELRALLSEPDSIIRQALIRTCPRAITQGVEASYRPDSSALVAEGVATIVETMIEAGRGGLIAILPHGAPFPSDLGKFQIVDNSRYLLQSSLLRVARSEAKQLSYWFEAPKDEHEDGARALCQFEARRARMDFFELAQLVGCLTSIDNALLLGPELAVLCAGYHVEALLPLPTVRETTSLDGSCRGEEFVLTKHGSRHTAAASFAARFPGAVVFILSEDGALRCLHRATASQEDVLLWNIRAPVEL